MRTIHFYLPRVSFMSIICSILPILVLSLSLSGCGSSDSPASDKIGYKVLKSTSNELSGIYEENGKYIYWEAIRGTPIESPQPGEPTHLIDVRLSDSNGHVFHIEIGGHTPIRSEWATEPESVRTLSENDASDISYLTERLANSLINDKSILGLDDVKDRLVNAALFIHGTPLVLPSTSEDKKTEKLLTPGVGDQCGNFVHIVEVKKKSAFLKDSTYKTLRITKPFEHSAVLVSIYSISGNKRIFNRSFGTSNHGTVASDPSMIAVKKCSKEIRRNNNTVPFMKDEPCSNNYILWAAIDAIPLKYYNMLSGWHTCNNDAYLQYLAATQNSTPTNTALVCMIPKFYAITCD